MWLRIGFLTLCLMLALTVGAAQATPLSLTLSDSPDVFSSFIDVTYTALTDAFTAAGFALTLDDDGVGPALNISSGTFRIDATIGATGVATAGELRIGGAIPELALSGPSLLTGALTGFGFSPVAGSPLEFLFAVTGGDLATLYGGVGAKAGVILGGSGFGGSFTTSFDNRMFGIQGTGSAVSDTAPLAAPVPEPATLLLMLGGGGLLYGLRRRGRAGDSRSGATENGS